MKTDVEDVAIGTAGGSVVGLIFSRILRGTVIGLVGGSAYVVAKKGKEVELPAQTGMLVRMDSNVALPSFVAAQRGVHARDPLRAALPARAFRTSCAPTALERGNEAQRVARQAIGALAGSGARRSMDLRSCGCCPREAWYAGGIPSSSHFFPPRLGRRASMRSGRPGTIGDSRACFEIRDTPSCKCSMSCRGLERRALAGERRRALGGVGRR